jgi:hypothetical protein
VFGGGDKEDKMTRTAWYLERCEKAATGASWTGEFTDFAQALEFATSVIGSGKEEQVRFIAPNEAPGAQIEQLEALGATEKI